MAIPAYETKHKRPTQKYKAKFVSRNLYGTIIENVREYWSVNKFQAEKIAKGIAAKNNWSLTGVSNV